MFIWNGWVFMIYLVSVIDVNYCLGLFVVDEDVDLFDLKFWMKL